MTHPDVSPSRAKLARLTFAERFCGYHRRPISAFDTLGWRYGASVPTRVLRPLILFFSQSYFQAEEIHLVRAAECRWRQDIVEELEFMRVSPCRRGIWRHLGIGLSGARLLKYYDHMVAIEVMENEAVRIAQAKARARSGCPVNQQSL